MSTTTRTAKRPRLAAAIERTCCPPRVQAAGADVFHLWAQLFSSPWPVLLEPLLRCLRRWASAP